MKRSMAFIFLSIFWCGIQAGFAKLPEKHEVAGLRVDNLRMDGLVNNTKFNYDSEEMFHPFFTESINAILQFYKTPYELVKKSNASGQEPTADEYVHTLRENKVIIYKMRDLQGRVLRVLLNSQVPVLAVKKIRTTQQNFSILRIQGSVIHLYRTPNFTQSSKIQPGDRKYEFLSAFGATWVTADLEKLGVGAYDYFCVVATPDMPLKSIQKKINDGLADVGFEYKLPEFEEMKGGNLTY